MEKLNFENYIYKESGMVPYEELTLEEKKELQENLIQLINQNTNFQAEQKK